MKCLITVAVLGLASVAYGQSRTVTSGTYVATATRSLSSHIASQTGQPCAIASSYLAAQSPGPYAVPASIANACQSSVPFVKQDALRLIDGVVAALHFQSDLGILKSPPAEYPLAGADLLGDLATLRSQANSGAFTNEIDFERNLTHVLGKPQDGHLAFQLDGISVFFYQRWVTGLVSVSTDGKSLPNLYVYTDLASYLLGYTSMPSAVLQIDGQNASTFLQQKSQNITYGNLQDPDSLYNNELWALNSGQGNEPTLGAFVTGIYYYGDETTITFANGTVATQANVAQFNPTLDFTGLTDGASYYNLYCNATAKALADGYDINDFSSNSKRKRSIEDIGSLPKRQQMKRRDLVERATTTRTPTETYSTEYSETPTATQLTGYPSPVAISDDLSLSGYFLEESGFTDTAVLVAQVMSEGDAAGFASTLTTFMDACRSENKKRLVIDIQGNPGGSVALGYEIFKQLFPNLDPYGAGTLAAFEGLNTLGTFYTNYTTQVVQAVGTDNATLLYTDGYYVQFSAETFTNASGQHFSSWPQLYGPVKTAKGNYTNLIRNDYNDINFDEINAGFVISGYGNNTKIAASPFTSDNIIILSDGKCSSTCTIMSHLLKWQGKVKSIAVGGRPENGAMQAVGGVKGSQVYQYGLIAQWVDVAVSAAQYLGYNDQVRNIENSPTLGPIYNDSAYIIYRGSRAGTEAGLQDFTFNFLNNIAEHDASYTPLQYVYEAADCRLWLQPQHIYDIESLWYTTASQAFGLNGTQQYSLCVQGSTNASSSLSGNATLFNNGVPQNVTTFPAAASSSSSGSGSGSNSGASQLAVSSVAAIIGFVALLFAL